MSEPPIDEGSVAAIAVVDGAAHRPAPEVPRTRRRLPGSGLVILVTLLGSVLLVARNYYVLTTPIREDTDYAANSILVNKAIHFTLLYGNYSREGFHHPGPAYLYILSFGQEVFYDFLHLVPAPFNGQLLAVFILNALCIGLLVLAVRDLASRPIVVLALLAPVLLLTGASLQWASAWMPYLYTAPFLLASVSGAAVAVGNHRALPIYIFGAGLLIHGHVAFVGIIGLYSAVIATFWMLRRRRARRTSRDDSIPLTRRGRVVSAVLVVAYLLPIVVNLALHFPAQWGAYWSYTRSNGHKNPHTIAQALSFVGGFWGSLGQALALVACGVLATVLVLRDHDTGRRRLTLALLLAVVVMTIETTLYALKGVDYLVYTYTAYFYYSIPALLAAALAIQVVGRVADGAFVAKWIGGARGYGAFLVLASATIAWVTTLPILYWSYRGDPLLPKVVNAVNHDRMARPVVIDLGDPGIASSDWVDVVGLLVQESRDRVTACVANGKWAFMVTPSEICNARQAADGFGIVVSSAASPLALPKKSTVIVATSTYTVYRDPKR